MKQKPAHNILSFREFLTRMFYSIFFGLICILLSLLLGMLGYHYYENMSWVDAFVNAAMILSGMGPLTALKTNGGKLFAGFYALFSGLVFIIILGVIFAPVVHRFFHKLHLKIMESNS